MGQELGQALLKHETRAKRRVPKRFGRHDMRHEVRDLSLIHICTRGLDLILRHGARVPGKTPVLDAHDACRVIFGELRVVRRCV